MLFHPFAFTESAASMFGTEFFHNFAVTKVVRAAIFTLCFELFVRTRWSSSTLDASCSIYVVLTNTSPSTRFTPIFSVAVNTNASPSTRPAVIFYTVVLTYTRFSAVFARVLYNVMLTDRWPFTGLTGFLIDLMLLAQPDWDPGLRAQRIAFFSWCMVGGSMCLCYGFCSGILLYHIHMYLFVFSRLLQLYCFQMLDH